MASVTEDKTTGNQPQPTPQADTGAPPQEPSILKSAPEVQLQSTDRGPSSAAQVGGTATEDIQINRNPKQPSDPLTFMNSFKLSMTSEEAWQKVAEKWTTIDKEMVEGWREDLDNLLIFAGLFSAVVTTFVVDSYKGLQGDPMTTTNLLLAQISMQLVSFTTNQGFINSTVAINSALTDAINNASSSPTIPVNSLWFASLIFSLGVASVAILVRQWLREFLHLPIANHQASVYIHQLRRESLEHWKVPQIIATLPVLMEVALALFFIGLVQQLLSLDSVVGGIAAALIAVTLLFLVVTSILPAVFDECSYHSPQAWALIQVIYSFAMGILSLIQRFSLSQMQALYSLPIGTLSLVQRFIAASMQILHNLSLQILSLIQRFLDLFKYNLQENLSIKLKALKLHLGQSWNWQENTQYKNQDQQKLKLNILQKTVAMFPDDDDIPQALARFLTEAAGSLGQSLEQLESLVQLSRSEEDTIVYAEPYAWKLYFYAMGNILQQCRLQENYYVIDMALSNLDQTLQQFINMSNLTSTTRLPATIAFYYSLLLPLIVDLCPLLKSFTQSQLIFSTWEYIYSSLNKISEVLESSHARLWLNESRITITAFQAEYHFKNTSLSSWQGLRIKKQDSILFYTKEEYRNLSMSDKRQRLNVTLLYSLNHNSEVLDIQFSPDGSNFAVVLYVKVVIYDAKKHLPIWEIGSKNTRTVSFHPEGKYLAIANSNREIQIWNITTQKIHRTLSSKADSISKAYYSPNGQFLVSASGSIVTIWNMSDESTELLILSHSDYVISVCISPNSQLIVTASWGNSIYLWSSQTGYKLACLTDHDNWIRSVAFTPDGMQLISESDKTLKYWDISSVDSTKPAIDTTEADNKEQISAISNNQNIIARRELLRGHTDQISSIAVSPNGKWIVSGSYDRTVKFWDAKNGAIQCTLKGHTDYVSSVSLSSSEKLLATGDIDGTVHIWRYDDLETEDSE